MEYILQTQHATSCFLWTQRGARVCGIFWFTYDLCFHETIDMLRSYLDTTCDTLLCSLVKTSKLLYDPRRWAPLGHVKGKVVTLFITLSNVGFNIRIRLFTIIIIIVRTRQFLEFPLLAKATKLPISSFSQLKLQVRFHVLRIANFHIGIFKSGHTKLKHKRILHLLTFLLIHSLSLVFFILIC